MKGDYFVKSEQIIRRRVKMVVLNVSLDNFYAFKNFNMNFTYPKKIVGSCIKEEHLQNHPNFRYKKVNIIMGANASGKTSFGKILMDIFNFMHKKNLDLITDAICDKSKDASFSIDLASNENVLYRVYCNIYACVEEDYTNEHINLEIRQENILSKDSYESCIKRLESKEYLPDFDYVDELKKLGPLDWIFEYPRDVGRILRFPKNDDKFLSVLTNILKSLDPAILSVELSQDVENSYVIRFKDKAVVLQDGELFKTNLLSSGTKAGVEVAPIISSLLQGKYTFYYCDEKFTYIHSDVEKAILSLMIDYIKPNDQLFFTTHNTDILDMNLPKHSFTFLCKKTCGDESVISCIEASSLLKRSTDSLKNAVDNDLFSCAPSVDLIYDIAAL